MRHRSPHFYEEGSDLPEECRLNQLVDSNLSTEAAVAAEMVEMSLIAPVGRRAVAVFLQRDDCEKLAFERDELMAGLLMESLPAFAHANGGEIVKAFELDRGVELNPTMYSISSDGDGRSFLIRGYMCIHFPAERIVVSAEPSRDGIIITVRSNRDPNAFYRNWETYTRENNTLRGRAFFADGNLIERKKNYSWDSIVLPEETKQIIRLQVQDFISNREALKLYNVKSRRGLILSGEPGTGKTLLGKVLADTLNVSFIWTLPRHIKGPESLGALVALARFVSPTVLFLEDLDLYAEDRHAKGWLGLGELMNQLDGVLDNEDVITIATTNRLEVIENALRNRPGRFDRTIVFGSMQTECRRVMVEKLLSKADILPEDSKHLVNSSDGCTGAQLEEISNTILMLAVSRAKEQGVELNGDAVPVDRKTIDAAIEQILCNRKNGVGFNTA